MLKFDIKRLISPAYPIYRSKPEFWIDKFKKVKRGFTNSFIKFKDSGISLKEFLGKYFSKDFI